MIKKPIINYLMVIQNLINELNINLNLRPQNLSYLETYYKLIMRYEKLIS